MSNWQFKVLLPSECVSGLFASKTKRIKNSKTKGETENRDSQFRQRPVYRVFHSPHSTQRESRQPVLKTTYPVKKDNNARSFAPDVVRCLRIRYRLAAGQNWLREHLGVSVQHYLGRDRDLCHFRSPVTGWARADLATPKAPCELT